MSFLIFLSFTPFSYHFSFHSCLHPLPDDWRPPSPWRRFTPNPSSTRGFHHTTSFSTHPPLTLQSLQASVVEGMRAKHRVTQTLRKLAIWRLVFMACFLPKLRACWLEPHIRALMMLAVRCGALGQLSTQRCCSPVGFWTLSRLNNVSYVLKCFAVIHSLEKGVYLSLRSNWLTPQPPWPPVSSSPRPAYNCYKLRREKISSLKRHEGL